ncbi:MAG: hypothetical protein HXX17_17080, partial [Geobacteraceae bacterium]|nr:hypothetical protein [Geobacteraceae bacterium]
DSNYNVSATSAAASIQISKATQTIIFPDLPAKTYKDADFAPGATASSRLTVTYASSNLAVATIVNGQIHIVGAGSADITVSQSGDANYGPATEVVKSLKVNQLTPVINWATPSAINSITPLSATQLNAIATIAGNFIYTPASGTVLNAGTQILSVTFTPTDNVNYSSASKPVNLTVTQWYPTGSLSGGATPNITDALRVMRSTVGLETLTAVEQRNADVAPLIGGKPSPNGKIDAGDALIILKLVVGIIPAW